MTRFVDENVLLRISRRAFGALTARRLARLDVDNHEGVETVDDTNQIALGVVEFDAKLNDDVSLLCAGHVAIRAGAAVTAGDELMTDESGRVVPRGAVAAQLYHVVGRALTAAATGELVMVAWGPYSVWGANAA